MGKEFKSGKTLKSKQKTYQRNALQLEVKNIKQNFRACVLMCCHVPYTELVILVHKSFFWITLNTKYLHLQLVDKELENCIRLYLKYG